MGKSHLQIEDFGAGLVVPGEMVQFRTPEPPKFKVFELFRNFRAAAPPESQQNWRNHAKSMIFSGPFYSASNYAIPDMDTPLPVPENS